MDPRFVTRQIHAYLDYPVALSLIAAPFILQLGSSHPAAFWLAFVTGIAALVLTVLTDHELGVVPMLSYGFHLTVDRIVGITFLTAPIVLGFSGLDLWYYWLNAAAVLTVTSLHKPENSSEVATA